MRKRILLLAAGAMLVSLFVVNAQQVVDSTALTDYSGLHENTTPATYVDSVTVGGAALSDTIEGGGNAMNMVMPYFVLPDPMLNGGYDQGGTFTDAQLRSSWTWAFNGAAPTGGQFRNADFAGTLGHDTDTLNQVFVDWGTATGSFRIDVTEVSNPTNCTGNTNYILVEVIDAPTAGVANADNEYCETDPAVDVDLSIDLTGKPPFQVRIDSIVNTIDPATGNPVNESVDFEMITTGAANGSTVGGGTLVDNGNDSWTFTLDTKVMDCNAGRITERIYRVTGVNGRISRKSDRAVETGGNNIFYAADDGVTNTSYPTPNTGNIYNIDNY